MLVSQKETRGFLSVGCISVSVRDSRVLTGQHFTITANVIHEIEFVVKHQDDSSVQL